LHVALRHDLSWGCREGPAGLGATSVNAQGEEALQNWIIVPHNAPHPSVSLILGDHPRAFEAGAAHRGGDHGYQGLPSP